MKVLLAAGLVLALVAGGWALFIRSSDDDGRGITVGALEDAVKWPDAKTADERVAFAGRAGLDALNITTLWTPGQTQPEPGELAILRNVSNAARAIRRVIFRRVPEHRYQHPC